MIGKKWVRDKRLTIKSCAAVVVIGVTVACAMLIIRLVGEHRLQRFLNKLFQLKPKEKPENLAADVFMPDKQT